MLNWQKTFFYLLPPLLALGVFFGVNFKTDLSAFIIAGKNAEEILLASEMQSGTLSRRYLLSVGSTNNTQVPTQFIRRFQQQLKTVEGVVDVWSPGQQADISKTLQTLYGQHGAGLYSLNPEQDLARLFSTQGLEQQALMIKNSLLSPQASMIKKVALQDPLLLILHGFQSIGSQIQQVKQGSNYKNLILQTAMAGLDAPQQRRIQSEISSVFKQLNDTEQTHFQLEITGVPIFAVATQSLIQGDITKVSIISSIALMVLFLLIFRSVGVMFQVFSLLIIVILSSMLSTQLAFGYVHGMTVAIGSTLVGICIDYPIHAVAHAQSVAVNKRATMIARIWPSMLLGGVTTMIGYVALGLSGYPGFQQVAVYAATGIITSLLLTRFILPKLNTSKGHRQLKIPLVSLWSAFCIRFRYGLVAVILFVLGASLFSLNSLRWLEDMQQLTPELDYLKQTDKRIRSRMTSIEPGRFVLISGKTIESALQKAEQVYPLLDQLKQQGALTDYFGLYPWLLSSQKQQQNQSLLQHYLTENNQSRWQQALKKQGLSVKRLGDLSYPAIEALTLEQVFKTPVKKLIDSRIIIGEKQTVIMIWLAEHDPKVVQYRLEKIEDAAYFSQRDMLNNMTKDYTSRAKTLLMTGLLLIVLVLIIRYKSVVKTIQTLLPAISAALIILAIWSLTAEAISFLHLIGFLLVVAICVDYGIFYQENRGGNIALTYQAMAASMLTSAIAFGSLLVAESTSLRILAGVVAFGVVLGFVLCPIIILNKSVER